MLSRTWLALPVILLGIVPPQIVPKEPRFEAWYLNEDTRRLYVSINGEIEPCAPIERTWGWAPGKLTRLRTWSVQVAPESQAVLELTCHRPEKNLAINLGEYIKEHYEQRNFGAPSFGIVGLLQIRGVVYVFVSYIHSHYSLTPSLRGGVVEIRFDADDPKVTGFVLLPPFLYLSVLKASNDELTILGWRSRERDTYAVAVLNLRPLSVGSETRIYSGQLVDRNTLFGYAEEALKTPVTWDRKRSALVPYPTKYPLHDARLFQFGSKFMGLTRESLFSLPNGPEYKLPSGNEPRINLDELFSCSAGIVTAQQSMDRTVCVIDPNTLKQIYIGKRNPF